jgi:glycosyltransferase involved in cell wall biosynthesis
MCGICGGRFAPLPGSRLDPAALVQRMADVQRHRGPDDDGFFADGALRLGFRRLSIIDVAGGHQPLGNEDGSIQVILNGEVYNFRELRARLEGRHTFRTRSDTEVIAHLYEEKGDDCFAELNGAGAAAAASRGDAPARLVFLGRVGPEKGSDVLLDAFELARRRVPGLRLELIGDGESPAALEAVAAHPAVRGGAATLLGPLGEERFARLLTADVFVLPTRADSFPLSILEAMACSLPVVASAVGAIPWLLDDGACGALVPAGDAGALAEVLVRLAGDPGERRARGERARQRQGAQFDSAGAATALDAVLRQAAGLPAGGGA